MNIYKITRLNRPLSWRLTSNRIAILGSVAAGAIALGWWYFSRDKWQIFAAALVGVSAFIAWAVARELDPDRPRTATLAMILATVGAFGPWEPALLVSAIALVGLRVLAGTVGGELKPLDLIVLFGAAAYCGTRVDAWVVVLLLVLAVLDEQPAGYPVATVGMLLAAAGAGFLTDVDFPDNNMLDEELLWGLITIAAIALAIRTTRIRSKTDLYGHSILWPKVRAARVMAGFVVIGGIIGSDAGTLVLMTPVLAGLVATALYRTFRPA
ncbi:MAG: hypothetical protein DWQ20_03970 [Actinobacteria bacterium]|nr:MAG: hypothetical protein DWQ20_03970 [Actinomycetota bacterium]